MKRHIPNCLTCCNLICGCIATVFAMQGLSGLALLWIVGGAVFDFFDGFVARLLHVSSPIGKELDSLADDVTFGVAPSMILFSELCVTDYPSFLEPYREWLPYLAFVMAAFSALRLAKFNLDERQTTSFIGLPTPANALFWGSLIYGASSVFERHEWASVALIILSFISCWLLVCELPMFSLKFKSFSWRDNGVKYFFLVTCIPVIAFMGISGFAVVITWYVVLSMITAISSKSKEND